jgi:transcription elongation factor Elf1
MRLLNRAPRSIIGLREPRMEKTMRSRTGTIPVTVDCPSCGEKVSERLTRDDPKKQITCAACGESFTLDAHKFFATLDKATKRLGKIARTLGKR